MRHLNEELLENIYEYIIEYQKENGTPPNYRMIMGAMNMSSLNLVQRYIIALEKAEKIERLSNGKIKPIPRLSQTETTMVPLVGKIACGTPSFAVEDIEESYALPKSLFGDGNLFILRAFGDSMIDVGIEEGDLVVIRKQNYADDGDIVVAMVDEETTLKRIFHKNGDIILHPENKNMKDIHTKQCEVQGVLVSCIKMY